MPSFLDAMAGAHRLDRTAFYRTSGGQPFDTGRLGEATVVDVFDSDDGEVVHVVDGPLSAGASVRGEVDWPRRLDHMRITPVTFSPLPSTACSVSDDELSSGDRGRDDRPGS
jgi:Ser-tRNA(Ala) deacylase AlaX